MRSTPTELGQLERAAPRLRDERRSKRGIAEAESGCPQPTHVVSANCAAVASGCAAIASASFNSAAT
jgi:hypothetical protein